jgi:hypothetical protein
MKSLAKTPPTTDSPIHVDSLEVPLGCIKKYIDASICNTNYIYAKNGEVKYVCVSISVH